MNKGKEGLEEGDEDLWNGGSVMGMGMGMERDLGMYCFISSSCDVKGEAGGKGGEGIGREEIGSEMGKG